MIEIHPIDSTTFADFDKLHNRADLDDKTSRKMLTESRSVVMHWGVPVHGLFLDGELISVNVTNFSKRPRKNAWGRYLNFYLAYTAPAHRLKGYATMLASHLEAKALELGYSRMKSLAGSYAGVRLHMRMGHQFWGIGKKGELVVDTPLAPGMAFPEGIPIEARNASLEPQSMNVSDIVLALMNPRFDGGRLPPEVQDYYAQNQRQTVAL